MSLGLSGKGNGIFNKGSISSNNIKANKLNQVKTGWFVYSRLFAHNGSFAFVTEEFSGGLLSNESSEL